VTRVRRDSSAVDLAPQLTALRRKVRIIFACSTLQLDWLVGQGDRAHRTAHRSELAFPTAAGNTA
jgi:hypothetical protein